MCRVLGCVAREPVSLQRELLEADNPMIRQAEDHDSGWGLAVYRTADGGEPSCERFPERASLSGAFGVATGARGRIFNVHVRRATIGGLKPENTHPFCLGNYSFSHNGTILDFPRLHERGVAPPHGDTDSEYLFNFLMRDFDPAAVVDCLRRTVAAAVERSVFSGLNFLFSDGERLYAYRLGVFELHWRAQAGKLLVASEPLDVGGSWHSVQQDVLLVLDPEDPEEPHAERLLGEAALRRARIEPLSEGSELRGAQRAAFAADRSARLTGAARE